MGKSGAEKRGGKTAEDRHDRLKAALKANIAKRKSQAQKRAGTKKED